MKLAVAKFGISKFLIGFKSNCDFKIVDKRVCLLLIALFICAKNSHCSTVTIYLSTKSLGFSRRTDRITQAVYEFQIMFNGLENSKVYICR